VGSGVRKSTVNSKSKIKRQKLKIKNKTFGEALPSTHVVPVAAGQA
jgi:hypothetical protein